MLCDSVVGAYGEKPVAELTVDFEVRLSMQWKEDGWFGRTEEDSGASYQRLFTEKDNCSLISLF